MAKTYNMKLTELGNKKKIAMQGGISLVEEREAEIGILTSLINVASQSITDLAKYNVCLDFVKVLENLPEEEANVVIDSSDLINLKDGFKKSINKRPDSWVNFPNVFSQLANPEEKVV